MKKFFFFFVLVLCTVTLPAFGQMSDPEIMEMIQMSQEYNQQNAGVVNPDMIFPGQSLTYFFRDGAVESIIVESGDSQWIIVRDKLTKLREKHGEIINPVQPEPQPQVEPDPEPELVFTSPTMPWWVWVLLGLLAIGIIGSIVQYFQKRNDDPVTAGKPQVPGGVNDANAYKRMHEVAGSRFPGARLDIRNIRRGILSGLATVHYAEGQPKKLRLRGTPAYAGEVVVNGRTETIYFLQGCGNDARQGNYMSGDIVFEPDVIIKEDGSESPLPAPTPVTEKVEPVTLSAPAEPVHSEYDGQVKKAMELAEKVIVKDQSHEVTIEIPKGEGIFKVVFKAQYPRTEKEKKS